MLIRIILVYLVFASYCHADNQAYTIQVGDVIRIALPGEESIDRNFDVNRQGNIQLPEVGFIQVANLSEKEMHQKIKTTLKTLYRDLSNLRVYVQERRLLVNILGYVNQPGEVMLPANSGIQSALRSAGGLRPGAQLDRMQIRRNGEEKSFNYKAYLDTGDTNLLPKLQTLDTLFIPTSPMIGNIAVDFDPSKMSTSGDAAEDRTAIKIFGEVNSPGSFSYKKGNNLVDILMRAGGVTRYADVEQIRVISNDSPKPFNLKYYLDTGDNSLLPGIQEGTTIFVPKKNEIEEKYWLKVSPDRAIRIIGEVVRPGRYEWSNRMSLLDLLAHAGGPQSQADTTKIEILIPDAKGKSTLHHFNLDQYLADERSESDLPSLRAGSTIRLRKQTHSLSSDKTQWVQQEAEKSIYVFGQVGAPGRYRFNNDMSFLDILAAANGPSGSADIHNIRINHRNGDHTRVSKLDLGLYFETGDDSLLPQVQTGDTIYIPEKNRPWLNEPKESTVRVLGAVNKPGRYRFNDSMTLLDLLAQAGGTSTNAYVKKISVVNFSCCNDQARTFDLTHFSKTADFTTLPVLRAGDTIYVPDKGDSVFAKARSGLKDIFQVVTLASLLGLM